MALAAITLSCEKEEDVPDLDPQLIGTWIHTSEEEGVLSWKFEKNGVATHVNNGNSFSWKWSVDEDILQLLVPGGMPRNRKYKIEKSLLYIFDVHLQDWGPPYLKQ